MRTLIVLLFVTQICFCQNDNNKKQFIISGSVIGKDTGKIVLSYNDTANIGKADTAIIKDGKFTFTGTVNYISDAYLWTVLPIRSFNDKSVIRFLLEAGNISISYKEGLATKAIITGSKSQTEWEAWENEKDNYVMTKAQYRKKADSIYILSKTDTTQYHSLRSLVNQLDTINDTIKKIDLNYIPHHPNSYLSALLLSKYKRQLPAETIEYYYDLLTKKVKNSNVGYVVLNYVYTMSNNSAFRNANPLNGKEFNEKLAGIKSIYDLSSFDSSGNTIDFKRFKGKCVLIDFWASWCKPCIGDIPYLKKIIEKYKYDSIQFISVSMDTDEKKWKKAIVANNLKWLQVADLNGFHGLVPTFCKINIGVPQYVLVNKRGEIINSNAPRPDEPEIKIAIENALKNDE